MELNTLSVSYAASGGHVASIPVSISEATVGDFKKKLEAVCGTPARYQRLLLQRTSEELEDDSRILSAAGVAGDDELQLTRQMPKDSDLLDACKDKEVEPSMDLLEYMMSANEACVNFVDDQKWTCLHHAVRSGRRWVCEALLDASNFNLQDALAIAPAESRQDWSWPALHMAITAGTDGETQQKGGHEAIVRLLLESPKYTAVDFEDSQFGTALHLAVAYQCVDMCRILIESPAFNAVNSRGPSGTALDLAIGICGDAAICRLLLDSPRFTEAGAITDGNTVLHQAAKMWGYSDAPVDEIYKTEICRAILEGRNFTEINAVTTGVCGTITTDSCVGQTALHLAAIAGHGSVCRLLLESPKFTAVNVIDSKGCTALHIAATRSTKHDARKDEYVPSGSANAILDSKKFTAFEAVNHDGDTAFQLAARTNNNPELCRLLLASPASAVANIKTSKGENALHLASGYLHSGGQRPWDKDVCRILVESPNFEGTNDALSDGNTALHLWAGSEIPEHWSDIDWDEGGIYISEYPNGKAPHYDKYLEPICRGLLESASFTAANEQNNKGYTALHLAIRVGYPKASCAILESSKFTAVNAQDKEGCTALHLAARFGLPDVACALLESPKFTARDIKNNEGVTGLAMVAPKDILRILESGKVDLDAVLDDVCVALVQAVHLGSSDVLRTILGSPKFDVVSVVDRKGCSALHAAGGHESLFQILLESTTFDRNAIGATSATGRTILHEAVRGTTKWEWTENGVEFFESECNRQLVWGGVPTLGEVFSTPTQEKLKRYGFWRMNYDARFNRVGIVVSEAAKQRQVAVCKRILEMEEFTAADSCDEEVGTALTVAADHGHIEVFRLLLDSPKFHAVNAATRDGRTALIGAARNPEMFRLLLSSPDFDAETLNSKTSCGQTALHEAAKAGHEEICRQLLESSTFTVGNAYFQVAAYADACKEYEELQDEYGDIRFSKRYDLRELEVEGGTALHISYTWNEHKEISRLLLASPKFTAVNEHHHNHGTVFHQAAGDGDVETCKLLLESKDFTSINSTNSSGLTALECVCNCGDDARAAEICKLILASPDFSDATGKLRVLHKALGREDETPLIEVCKALLDSTRFQSLNYKDEDGDSALHVVVMTTFSNEEIPVETVRLLLECPRVDVNCVNNQMRTAMHCAAKDCTSAGEEPDMLRVFLESKAFNEVNKANKKGQTVLHEALFTASDKKEMEELGVEPEEQEIAAEKACRLILESPKFTARDARDENGKTALDIAVDSGLERICKLLREFETPVVDPDDIQLLQK